MTSAPRNAALAERISHAIDELKGDIADLETASRPVAPDNAVGRLSRMEAINDQQMQEANLAKARRRLRQLEQALERVDDPDFGVCEECGEPIAEGRLMLMPEARRCVGCAD